MFTGRVFNNSKVLLIPLLAVLFTTPALLSGCSGGSGQPGADGATQADVGLSFPKGYTYDPATGALYPPSGENYASLPPYVTGITLIIS
ncbi:MAG: hypothetical protein OEZ04_02290, partial [Nitrospinota bacterium]|nr:hypothetical protein [Nitrospinota bacterium]